MTIGFTNTDDFVETVHNYYDEDPSLSLNLLETGTKNYVSDYKEKVQEAPVKMPFSLKECHTIFAQPTGQGAFVRVCGNKEDT